MYVFIHKLALSRRHLDVYIYTCICIYIFIYVYVYVFVSLYTYVYLYVYLYVYMYVYIYTYAYMYRNGKDWQCWLKYVSIRINTCTYVCTYALICIQKTARTGKVYLYIYMYKDE